MTFDRPILALALAQTVVWSGSFYAFPSLLIFWEADLGWSKAELTAAFTATLLVSALFSPLAGRLIDRGLGPAVLSGSIGLAGLVMAALSFAESYGAFLLLWAAMGVAMAGALYEPCFALVTRARGAGARRSITLITLVAGFAGTLSFPIGDIVSSAHGWRAAALSYAGMTILIALPLALYGARLLERTRVKEPDADPLHPAETSHAFLRRPAFWALAFAFAAIAFNHGAVINHIRPLLDERGIASEAAVLAAAMIGPMQVFGRLVVMTFERSLSNAAVAGLCFLGLTLSPLMLLWAGGASLPLGLFVLLQGGAWGITSIIKPAITRDTLGQRNFGIINGALALPFWMTMALAPLAGSLLWEAGGYDLMLWCVAAAALLGFFSLGAALKLHARG